MLIVVRSTQTLRALPIVFLLACGLHGQTLAHQPAAQPPEPPVAATPESGKTLQSAAKPVLPQGTNFQVEIDRHYPMKAHEPIEGRLLHPIYLEGKLAVPQNTPLRGTIVALEPDTRTRWHGRLRGDFTPFHTAQVEFHQLLQPSGALELSTGGAISGVPVLYLAAPGVTARQSIFARYWSQAKNQLHDRIAYFTAPGLGDRATQMLYHQLPYHPERIEAMTMWSFDLSAPLALPDTFPVASVPDPAAPILSGKPEIWSIHALLTADQSSATAKPGDPVKALVLEPVFDKDHELVVPQDSILVGKVTAARAARSLGRNGKLRFTFQQVRFPQEAERAVSVQGALAGATAETAQGLTMDTEGTVSPRNQSSVIAPLLLTMLAGRALDDDGNLTAQTGVASNGLGLIGRVVGAAVGNRNLAAGIGYYAAALSVYENFLRRGRDVVFPKDTHIEIETTPLRAPVLTPEQQ